MQHSVFLLCNFLYFAIAKNIQKEKKLSNGDTVVVNILDPMGGVSAYDMYFNGEQPGQLARKQKMIIGQDIPLDTCNKFLDSKTKEIYMMIVYKNGSPETYVMRKDKWLETKQQMDRI